MTDSIEAPQIDKSEAGDPTSKNTDEAPAKSPQQQRAEYFISDLDTKLNAEDIKVAFAVIIDPKSTEPILYARGSTYNLARILVEMARFFKGKLNKELEI